MMVLMVWKASTTRQPSNSGEKENMCARRSDQAEDRDIKAQGRVEWWLSGRLTRILTDTNVDIGWNECNTDSPSWGFQVEISTITKGVPIAKLELRHQRLPCTKTNVQVKFSIKTNTMSLRRQGWLWTRLWRSFCEKTLLLRSFKCGDKPSSTVSHDCGHSTKAASLGWSSGQAASLYCGSCFHTMYQKMIRSNTILPHVFFQFHLVLRVDQYT